MQNTKEKTANVNERKRLDFKSEKRITFILIIGWAIGTAFMMPTLQEPYANIKYAPDSSFFSITGAALACNFIILLLALPRVWRAQESKMLSLPIFGGMLACLALSTLPHAVNMRLAAPDVYTVSTEVVEKSRLRRTPRGGKSFLIHRLHVSFDNARVGEHTLNGPHTVFVTEKKFDQTRIGDTLALPMRSGPIAAFMLHTPETIDLPR